MSVVIKSKLTYFLFSFFFGHSPFLELEDRMNMTATWLLVLFEVFFFLSRIYQRTQSCVTVGYTYI